MNIVCLAWGSLIWKPGALPIVGPWLTGGPALPIDFCRVGDKGELATAPCQGAPLVRVRWARLGVDSVVEARELLRRREEIPDDRPDGIGAVIVGQGAGRLLGAEEILRWATDDAQVDAVVWTALPPRFAGIEGRAPAPEEAVHYLAGLTGEVRAHAEEYLHKAPADIKTSNRSALERFLATGTIPGIT